MEDQVVNILSDDLLRGILFSSAFACGVLIIGLFRR